MGTTNASGIAGETVKWLKIIENSSEESNMTRNRALAIRLSFDKFQVKQIST